MEGADPREDELTGSGEQQMPVTPVPLLCWHSHNLPLLLSPTKTLALRCVALVRRWSGGGDPPTSGSAAATRARGEGGRSARRRMGAGIRHFFLFFPAPPLTRSAIAGNVSSRRLRTTQPLIDLDRCLLG
jgi:hypothetical protein